MGKARGFIEDARVDDKEIDPKERINNYQEFHLPLSKEEQQIQAGRCMDCGVAFCHTGIRAQAQRGDFENKIGGGDIGCPLHNLIPEWNDLLYRGLWREAYERLSLTNPFPEFTGKICPAPCEDSCVCAINGESVTIKSNELAIIQEAFKQGYVKPFVSKKKQGKKIAIIGSGPAGLACAHELNMFGYDVAVFERSDRLGGIMMYGIPDVKLDKAIIHRRIKVLEQSGILFHTNSSIQTQEQVAALQKEYDAIVLATGASKPRDLSIEGRELEGVMFALDFLTQNTKSLLDKQKGDHLAKDKHVIIIGSGDTSVDCVGVALRQGAKSIMRFERSKMRSLNRPSNNPWPLSKRVFQTDYGIREAIEYYGFDPRIYQKLTKRFVGQNGKLTGVIAADLEQRVINGESVSVEVEDTQREYRADLVLLAIGFDGGEDCLVSSFGVKLDAKRNIIANDYLTTQGNIYACGDAKMGQSLVVWAIKDGILCAQKIHRDLAYS